MLASHHMDAHRIDPYVVVMKALTVAGGMALLGFIGGAGAGLAKETARVNRRRALEIRLDRRVVDNDALLAVFVAFADSRRANMDALQRLGRRVGSLLYFDDMVTRIAPDAVRLGVLTEVAGAVAAIQQLLRDFYMASGTATRRVNGHSLEPVNTELASAQDTFLRLVDSYAKHISDTVLKKVSEAAYERT